MVVAGEAGECQVLGWGWAAMFARDDVIDLEGKNVVLLRHLAILTDALGAPPNQTCQARIHGEGLVSSSAGFLERLPRL